MKYQKLDVVNGKTKWTAELLGHVEDGIIANESKIDEVEGKIPDISNLATKEEIPDVSEFITAKDLPDTSNFATKDEIPDISNLASKDEIPDVSNFATKDELPSTDGLATEQYVKDEVAAIPNLDILKMFSLRGNYLFFGEQILLELENGGDEPEPDEPVAPPVVADGFNVLFIGNSYSEDTAAFMPAIVQALGVEKACIRVMQYGGRALAQHRLSASDYLYLEYGVGTDGNLNTLTTLQENKSLREAVTEVPWTWIILQQASKDSGKPETYSNLQPLIDDIKLAVKDTNPGVKFAFNMTWPWQKGYGGYAQHGYADQDAMYAAICDAVATQVLTSPDISTVLPTGTAVQNLRGFLNKQLNADQAHLNGNASFSAGLAATLALLVGTEHITEATKYSPNTYAPYTYNDAGVQTHSNQPLKTRHDHNDTFNTNEMQSYVLAAIRAVTSPYAVDASYVLDMPGYYKDTILTPADVQTGVTYEWPNADTYYSPITGKTLTYSKSNATNRAMSRIFTKATLPVGSVIELGNSWHLYPQKWPAYNKPNPIDETDTQKDIHGQKVGNKFTITEEFWEGYEYVAFNIGAGSASMYEGDRIARLKNNGPYPGYNGPSVTFKPNL